MNRESDEAMIVIKYGGHAMTGDNNAIKPWVNAIKNALANHEQFIIVHGGGPQIDREISAAGLKKEVIGGYRVTTPEVFSIVEKVLWNGTSKSGSDAQDFRTSCRWYLWK